MCIVVYSISESSLATLIFFIGYGLNGWLVITVLKLREEEKNIFFLVYGLSSIAAVILFYIYSHRYGVPFISGGSDDMSYENDAFLVSTSVLKYNSTEIGFIVKNIFHNSKGYIYIISLFMRVSSLIDGYDTMIPRLFNNMSLGFISLIVFLLTSFQKTRFLGEPERYVEMSIPFIVIFYVMNFSYFEFLTISLITFSLSLVLLQFFYQYLLLKRTPKDTISELVVDEIISKFDTNSQNNEVRVFSNNMRLLKFFLSTPAKVLLIKATSENFAYMKIPEIFDIYPYVRDEVITQLISRFNINLFILDTNCSLEAPLLSDFEDKPFFTISHYKVYKKK